MVDGSSNTFTRRKFLVGSVGSGVIMAFAAAGLSGCSNAPEQLAAKSYEPTLWFTLNSDGRITVYISEAEMGQHVGTALARIVAEELEADWNLIDIVHVDSDPKWGYRVTGGSWSVFHNFVLLSRAGAAGRVALIEAGATLMSADAADCIARNGRVIHGDESLSYGDIVARGNLDRTFTDEELEALPLKPASERRVLGQDVAALDIPDKTRGATKYGIDVSRDGMVYARPVLPPTRFGCALNGWDDGAAKEVPGYMKTVEIEDPSNTCQGWLAVVAETYPAAIAAADALTVDWTPGPRANATEAEILAEGERLVNDPASGSLWLREGDADAALGDAAQVVDATYTTSSVLHFQLEPANAVAYSEDGRWHIHSGNQWQSLILPTLATALGVEESAVTIHQYSLGGGFGRRLYGDYMVPAALVAKALGTPVKMVFTREDDSWLDCPRSPSVQRVRTGLDTNGNAIAYDHAAAAGWPTEKLIPGFLAEPYENGGKVDSFSISGSDHWYSIPAQRVRGILNNVAQETFVPGWLRAVGPGWTGWAVESHMDEIAHVTGKDPIELRLSLLDGAGRNAGKAPESVGGATRLAAVLNRVRDLSGWTDRENLPDRTALGVAVCAGQERTMPTWVACVAKVSVDNETGSINVEKLTTVIDAGTIIHPDGARAQAEGSLLWGLSMALHEATAIKDGRVADRNLDTYTPLRMDQVPELEIEFAENDHLPVGLGEPGVIVVAPAIANAVFAATGVRLRDLPMRPDAVKAGLA